VTNKNNYLPPVGFVPSTVLSESRCALWLRYVDKYTDLLQEKFTEKFTETPVPHHNAVCRLTEKVREKGPVLDAERSGRHHFQQLL
jgi:hypothetical protein